MSDVASQVAYRTVRYLRAESERALRGRSLSGVCVPSGSAGPLCDVWVHRAASCSGRPLIVEIHGGGFALGDARKGDALRQWVCDSFDVNVIGVGYRLAPESPAPSQRDDVVAAVEAACAGRLGIEVDASRVYLMGCSAGACLALTASVELARKGSVAPAGCILHYPYVDASESIPCNGDAIGLSAEMAHAFNVWYAGELDPCDPIVSPLSLDSQACKEFPPCWIYPVAGDPLMLQAEALRARLEGAGLACSWYPVEGAYHGYLEDAADMEAYRAQTMDTTLAARPDGFLCVARRVLREGFEHILGPAVRQIEFIPTER